MLSHGTSRQRRRSAHPGVLDCPIRDDLGKLRACRYFRDKDALGYGSSGRPEFSVLEERQSGTLRVRLGTDTRPVYGAARAIGGSTTGPSNYAISRARLWREADGTRTPVKELCDRHLKHLVWMFRRRAQDELQQSLDGLRTLWRQPGIEERYAQLEHTHWTEVARLLGKAQHPYASFEDIYAEAIARGLAKTTTRPQSSILEGHTGD